MQELVGQNHSDCSPTNLTTMVDVEGSMKSRRDRAFLLLLSKFIHPSDVRDLPDYWREPLHEAPQAAAQRMSREGLIEPAPLEVKLEIRFKVTELKSLLRGEGLKCSGKKADLIARIIEHDLTAIRKMAGSWEVFQCSEAGRALAEEFQVACETERNEAEREVLAFLTQGDYRGAVLRMAKYETVQVFWRGLGVDWAHYDPRGQEQTLRYMFAGWPGILQQVDSNLRDPLRLGAAMMELFGERTADKWFEELPDTGSHLDPNTVMRMLSFYGSHLRAMMGFRALGVRTVEILGGDDEESCPHCLAIKGRLCPIDDVPELPLATCTSPCGCRCMVVVKDFDS